MAKIKCIKCGNTLSNSSSPSENIIKIFPDRVVKSVLMNNPNMRFFDFETEKHTKFEYWICQQCNTVYCIENKPEGSAKFVYSKSEEECNLSNEDISVWNRLWVFSDEELFEYDEPEENWNATVEDFFNNVKPSHSFFISLDQKYVIVIENSTKKILAVYSQVDFL